MALANLTARSQRVFIGTDEQAWSFAAADFLPEQESMGESGLIKTFAQVTLIDVLSAPESIDPRANPSRWREGQTVRVDVATDAGGWFTWGYLRLLEIPSGPTDGRITLQLGCAIAWADDPQPEGDRSEVALGIGEDSAVVVTRLLVASGIPEAAIDLGTWDYDLPYALPKEGNGSYIAQAGALAFANHCRQLYQEPDGVIRVAQWGNVPGTAVATVTVGVNEALFVPSPDPVPPVERVVVSGVGYQPSTTPNRYSSSFTVTEPASNFSASAGGLVGITTTEIYEWGEPTLEKPYYWTRSETRLQQPQAVTWIGSDSTQPTTTISYESKRYDATTKILYRIETGEIANVRTLVDSTVTAAGTTLIQRTIAEVEHNAALETLTRRTETTTVPRITLTGDTGSTGRFVQETSRILETRWTEDRPDYWVERTSERVAAKNGGGRQGNIKPTALITQRPQVKPNSQPPATERWEDPTSLKEQHYTAECTWQHPGGATGRVRTRSLTLTPGFSNAQCFDVATREVQLLEGRREAHLIELPLSDALLWVPPLATVQVNDGANEWKFKLDAIAWSYATGEARLVAMGICVARVPVTVPVGTPLPAFVSGMEPGQVAPAEPAPFVPPADEVRDVAAVARARRGRASVQGDSPLALTARAAARRGRAAAAIAVEDVAIVRAVARRGRAATEILLPTTIAAAASARRGRAGIAIALPTTITTAASARRGRAAVAGGSFESETSALLAALSGTYDSARTAAIDALIAGLKADGDWAKFAALYIVGANTADSFINWKNPGTFNATNNGLAVTPFTRYQGNGANQYADTGIVPSTHLSLNSCGLAAGVLNNNNSGRIAIGCTDGTNATWFATRNASNVISVRVNQSGSSTGSQSDSSGISIVSRTGSGSGNIFYRRNGSAVSIGGVASSALPNRSLFLAARNNNGTPEEHSSSEFWMWAVLSTGPTTAEVDDIRARLATYQATL